MAGSFWAPWDTTKSCTYLKALMCGINAVGAQGWGCMVTFCHASLKMAILLHKKATVRFDLILAVCSNRKRKMTPGGTPCLKLVLFTIFIQQMPFTGGTTFGLWKGSALWRCNFEILVWIVYTSQFQKFIGLGVETAQVRRGSRSFLGLGQLRWSLKTFRPSDSFLGLACLIVSENKEESLSSVHSIFFEADHKLHMFLSWV